MGICAYYKDQIINEELKVNIDNKPHNNPNISPNHQEEIIKQESKSYLKYVKTKILGNNDNDNNNNIIASTENLNNEISHNASTKPKSIIKHRELNKKIKQSNSELEALSNNNEKPKIVKIKDDQSFQTINDPNNTKREFISRRKKAFQTVQNPKELENGKKLIFDGSSSNKCSMFSNSLISVDVDIKFERKKIKSITRIDDSRFLKTFLPAEMGMPVLAESLVTQQKGKINEKYKVLKKLGGGAYGSVYKAKNNFLNIFVAIKKIKKIKENESEDLNIKKNEIDILKKLSHPNIVKIYEFYSSKNHYHLITEYCKYGELFSYMRNSFSEKQLAIIFYQIISGLWYLHDNNIIHRDIKPENIMISYKEKDIETQEEYFWVKIIDFGTAKIFEKNKSEDVIIGSLYYIAPEVLKKNYNEKCDLWSVGVILYMALVGKAPYDGKSDTEILDKITKFDYNDKEMRFIVHSNEVKDLVSKLLEKDVNKRLSAKEALNHPWFKKYCGRGLFGNFKTEDIQLYINNLFYYSFNSKLQQLILAFLVHNLSTTSESSIIMMKMFRYFNLSGNCKLTKEELANGLYKYRDKEQVNKIVDSLFLLLDGDNNGYIEYEEFMRACIDKNEVLNKGNLRYAFKFIDDKNTNTLDVQKVIKAFVPKPNKILEAVINNTLKTVDYDGDGIINFKEFEELMLKTIK